MNIWQDKHTQSILSGLKNRIRTNNPSTKKDKNLIAPRFVFICGKKEEKNEQTVRSLTIKSFEKKYRTIEFNKSGLLVLCVISEKLYTQDLAEDIFSFEEMLAEISSKIIIVTESAGSFCELGAFVMNKDFCKKTIVINEDKPEYRESFVTKGPIKLIEKNNEDNVILYNGNNGIESNLKYNDCLKQISSEELSIPINTNSNNINLRGLIYELANIIELFEPIDKYEIKKLYLELKDFDNYAILKQAEHKIRKIEDVINLMASMQMITEKNGYYYFNKKISCFNTLFKITRSEFNNIRVKYLSRIAKIEPQRMI